MNTVIKKRLTVFWMLVALVFGMTTFAGLAHAGSDPVYTSFLSNKAADGYDVTAYFSEGKPVEGSSKFSTEYNGAIWQFTSQENLDLFIADPEKYAPQYGGYCAWAAAQGSIASGDPEQWTVHNGKLYLNYNKDINDRWSADKDNFIKQADGHWPAMLN